MRDNQTRTYKSTTATTFLEKNLAGTKRRGTSYHEKFIDSKLMLKSSTNFKMNKPHLVMAHLNIVSSIEMVNNLFGSSVASVPLSALSTTFLPYVQVT